MAKNKKIDNIFEAAALGNTLAEYFESGRDICQQPSACNYGEEGTCEYETCRVCLDEHDSNYLYNCNPDGSGGYYVGELPTYVSDPVCCSGESKFANKIVISEIKFRNNDQEFIELYNRSNETLNLRGCEINAIKWGTADGSVGYGFPDIVMPPQTYVVLYHRDVATEGQYDSFEHGNKDAEWAQAFCPECDDYDEDARRNCYIVNGCPINSIVNDNRWYRWPREISGTAGYDYELGQYVENDVFGYDCDNNQWNCNCPGAGECNSTSAGAIATSVGGTTGESITLRDGSGREIHRVDMAAILDGEGGLCSDCGDGVVDADGLVVVPATDSGCNNCFYDGGGASDIYYNQINNMGYMGEWHSSQTNDKWRNSLEMIDPQNGSLTDTSSQTWQISRFRGGTPGAPPNVYSYGCSDPNACNYDPGPTMMYGGVPTNYGHLDNGSCDYGVDFCTDCDGNPITENYDALGVCGGHCLSDADGDGICDECEPGFSCDPLDACVCTDAFGNENPDYDGSQPWYNQNPTTKGYDVCGECCPDPSVACNWGYCNEDLGPGSQQHGTGYECGGCAECGCFGYPDCGQGVTNDNLTGTPFDVKTIILNNNVFRFRADIGELTSETEDMTVCFSTVLSAGNIIIVSGYDTSTGVAASEQGFGMYQVLYVLPLDDTQTVIGVDVNQQQLGTGWNEGDPLVYILNQGSGDQAINVETCPTSFTEGGIVSSFFYGFVGNGDSTIDGNVNFYDINANQPCCDCDGNIEDQCGVCGGDGTSCVGCTDPTACNYNASATISADCTYANPGYDCDGICLTDPDCAGICSGPHCENTCGTCVNCSDEGDCPNGDCTDGLPCGDGCEDYPYDCGDTPTDDVTGEVRGPDIISYDMWHDYTNGGKGRLVFGNWNTQSTTVEQDWTDEVFLDPSSSANYTPGSAPTISFRTKDANDNIFEDSVIEWMGPDNYNNTIYTVTHPCTDPPTYGGGCNSGCDDCECNSYVKFKITGEVPGQTNPVEYSSNKGNLYKFTIDVVESYMCNAPFGSPPQDIGLGLNHITLEWNTNIFSGDVNYGSKTYYMPSPNMFDAFNHPETYPIANLGSQNQYTGDAFCSSMLIYEGYGPGGAAASWEVSSDLALWSYGWDYDGTTAAECGGTPCWHFIGNDDWNGATYLESITCYHPLLNQSCDCDGNCIDECGECGGPGKIPCTDLGDGTTNEGQPCDSVQYVCSDNLSECLTYDECGVCGGTGPGGDCGCDDIAEGACDCEGNVLDVCGVCGGDGLSCLDCAGTPNGDAYTNNCDECVTSDTDNCIQDCTGVWGGNAVVDECGVCEGPGLVNGCCNGQIQDCFGVCGGTAQYDQCGVCDGPGILLGECDCDGNVLDCAGECGGDAVEDECGVCGGDGIADGACDCFGNVEDCFGVCGGSSELDCNNVCGGTSVLDECGVCNGDGPEPGFDCDGNCIVDVDCNGVCGGDAAFDDCGVCRSACCGTSSSDDCPFIDGASWNVNAETSITNNPCPTNQLPGNPAWNSTCTGCMDELDAEYDINATIPWSDSCSGYSTYANKVIITELKIRPTNSEFIEIYNKSGETINIGGWEINAVKYGTASTSYGLPFDSYDLGPGEYVYFCQNPTYINQQGKSFDDCIPWPITEAQATSYGIDFAWPGYDCEGNSHCNCDVDNLCNPTIGIDPSGEGAIVSTGETITLRDANANTIDQVDVRHLIEVIWADCSGQCQEGADPGTNNCGGLCPDNNGTNTWSYYNWSFERDPLTYVIDNSDPRWKLSEGINIGKINNWVRSSQVGGSPGGLQSEGQSGCMDEGNCNFNEFATVDDPSQCIEQNVTLYTSCPDGTWGCDCSGVCGGQNYPNECGVCNEPNPPSWTGSNVGETCDCSGNQWDCAGNCPATSALDCTGTCVEVGDFEGLNGPPMYFIDGCGQCVCCNGEVDSDGVCQDVIPSEFCILPADYTLCELDCAGEFQGDAYLDECMQCVCCNGGDCGEPSDTSTEAWTTYSSESCCCCGTCNAPGSAQGTPCDNLFDDDLNPIACTDCFQPFDDDNPPCDCQVPCITYPCIVGCPDGDSCGCDITINPDCELTRGIANVDDGSCLYYDCNSNCTATSRIDDVPNCLLSNDEWRPGCEAPDDCGFCRSGPPCEIFASDSYCYGAHENCNIYPTESTCVGDESNPEEECSWQSYTNYPIGCDPLWNSECDSTPQGDLQAVAVESMGITSWKYNFKPTQYYYVDTETGQSYIKGGYEVDTRDTPNNRILAYVLIVDYNTSGANDNVEPPYSINPKIFMNSNDEVLNINNYDADGNIGPEGAGWRNPQTGCVHVPYHAIAEPGNANGYGNGCDGAAYANDECGKDYCDGFEICTSFDMATGDCDAVATVKKYYESRAKDITGENGFEGNGTYGGWTTSGLKGQVCYIEGGIEVCVPKEKQYFATLYAYDMVGNSNEDNPTLITLTAPPYIPLEQSLDKLYAPYRGVNLEDNPPSSNMDCIYDDNGLPAEIVSGVCTCEGIDIISTDSAEVASCNQNLSDPDDFNCYCRCESGIFDDNIADCGAMGLDDGYCYANCEQWCEQQGSVANIAWIPYYGSTLDCSSYHELGDETRDIIEDGVQNPYYPNCPINFMMFLSSFYPCEANVDGTDTSCCEPCVPGELFSLYDDSEDYSSLISRDYIPPNMEYVSIGSDIVGSSHTIQIYWDSIFSYETGTRACTDIGLECYRVEHKDRTLNTNWISDNSIFSDCNFRVDSWSWPYMGVTDLRAVCGSTDVTTRGSADFEDGEWGVVGDLYGCMDASACNYNANATIQCTDPSTQINTYNNLIVPCQECWYPAVDGNYTSQYLPGGVCPCDAGINATPHFVECWVDNLAEDNILDTLIQISSCYSEDTACGQAGMHSTNTVFDIIGCTDETACNYQPAANINVPPGEIGECYYPPAGTNCSCEDSEFEGGNGLIGACTSNGAPFCGYYADACGFEIVGCTNEEACNYLTQDACALCPTGACGDQGDGDMCPHQHNQDVCVMPFNCCEAKLDYENNEWWFEKYDVDKRRSLGVYSYDEDNESNHPFRLLESWPTIIGNSYEDVNNDIIGPHPHLGINTIVDYTILENRYNNITFALDADVRTKRSIYGTGGSLMKYYDKDIEPEKYKETTVPAEVQFYLYPRYEWGNPDTCNHACTPDNFGGDDNDWCGCGVFNCDDPQMSEFCNASDVQKLHPYEHEMPILEFDDLFDKFHPPNIWTGNNEESTTSHRKLFVPGCGYVCENLTGGGPDGADVFQCYPPGSEQNPFEDSYIEVKKEMYVGLIDWGDGEEEYRDEPFRLGNESILRHTYSEPGFYNVTGYVFMAMKADAESPHNASMGILSTENDETVVSSLVGKYICESDFYQIDNGIGKLIPGGGSLPAGQILAVSYVKQFTIKIFASPPPTFESAFYPYTETSPIINGVSKNSIYYKTIKRELGYFDIYSSRIGLSFDNSYDALVTENALAQTDADFSSPLLDAYSTERYEKYKTNTCVGRLDCNQLSTPELEQTCIDYSPDSCMPYNGVNELGIPCPELSENECNTNDCYWEVHASEIWGYNTAAEWGYNACQPIYEDGVFVKCDNPFPGAIDCSYVYAATGFCPLDTAWLLDEALEKYGERCTFYQEGDFHPNPIWVGAEWQTLDEMGDGIGELDLDQVRYFQEPFQMWEMLGMYSQLWDNSYIFKKTNTSPTDKNCRVLLTAPHAQKSERPSRNEEHDIDDYTGSIVKIIGEYTDCPYIHVVYKSDDPNYYHHIDERTPTEPFKSIIGEVVPFKQRISEYLNSHPDIKWSLDVHGSRADRTFAIDVGTTYPVWNGGGPAPYPEWQEEPLYPIYDVFSDIVTYFPGIKTEWSRNEFIGGNPAAGGRKFHKMLEANKVGMFTEEWADNNGVCGAFNNYTGYWQDGYNPQACSDYGYDNGELGTFNRSDAYGITYNQDFTGGIQKTVTKYVAYEAEEPHAQDPDTPVDAFQIEWSRLYRTFGPESMDINYCNREGACSKGGVPYYGPYSHMIIPELTTTYPEVDYDSERYPDGIRMFPGLILIKSHIDFINMVNQHYNGDDYVPVTYDYQDLIDLSNKIWCDHRGKETASNYGGDYDYWTDPLIFNYTQYAAIINEQNVFEELEYYVDVSSQFSCQDYCENNPTGCVGFYPKRDVQFTDDIAYADTELQGGHPGNPGANRYWKNIIPEDYDLTTREGVVLVTTSNDDGSGNKHHAHRYTIDGNGNGETDEVCHPEHPELCHKHIISNFQVLSGHSMRTEGYQGSVRRDITRVNGVFVNQCYTWDGCEGEEDNMHLGDWGPPRTGAECCWLAYGQGQADSPTEWDAVYREECEITIGSAANADLEVYEAYDCYNIEYADIIIRPHIHNLGNIYDVDDNSPQNWLSYDIYDEGDSSIVLIAEDLNNDGYLFWGNFYGAPGFTDETLGEISEFYFDDGNSACRAEGRGCMLLEFLYNEAAEVALDGLVEADVWGPPILQHYDSETGQLVDYNCNSYFGLGATFTYMYEWIKGIRARCETSNVLETITPYYPVLPKLKIDGTFDSAMQEIGYASEEFPNVTKIPFGDPMRSWNKDDDKAVINNKKIEYTNQINALAIDLNTSEIDGEDNSIEDEGGNLNKGHLINDYPVQFDEDTRKPLKATLVNNVKVGKNKEDKAY